LLRAGGERGGRSRFQGRFSLSDRQNPGNGRDHGSRRDVNLKCPPSSTQIRAPLLCSQGAVVEPNPYQPSLPPAADRGGCRPGANSRSLVRRLWAAAIALCTGLPLALVAGVVVFGQTERAFVAIERHTRGGIYTDGDDLAFWQIRLSLMAGLAAFVVAGIAFPMLILRIYVLFHQLRLRHGTQGNSAQ
jgi:hypothetical protein